MTAFATSTGQKVTVLHRIAGGGEGEIWSVHGQSQVVAKLYYADKRNKGNRESKLRVMVANPPRDEMRARWNHISIAWPEDVLYEQNSFAGYLMPKIGQPQQILEFYNPSLRNQKHPAFDWRHLHRTSSNLARALNALHSKGYIVGDFNEGNIFVSDSALVTLVDTDSFQVRDAASGYTYRCLVGKPEFTPPELQGADFSQIDRERHHDAFGLAVMIFLLLMEGYHPFTGYPVKSSVSMTLPAFADNIVHGIFPYDPSSGYGPPKAAPRFDILHPELQRLFQRCFALGHTNPTSRPTALDWAAALDTAEQSLIGCTTNSTHYFSNHLSQCPWCERERRLSQKPIRVPIPTPQPANAFRFIALLIIVALLAFAGLRAATSPDAEPVAEAVASMIAETGGETIPTAIAIEEVFDNGTHTDGEQQTPGPDVRDSDGDGLSDLDETSVFGTNPNERDSDGDSLDDGDELRIHNTDPNDRDSDGDSLDDGEEALIYDTHPQRADTDQDGVGDAEEIAAGSDPLVASAPTRPEPAPEQEVYCPGAFPTRLSIGDTAKVVNYQLNVRSGPSTQYSIVRRLDPGRTVEILDGPECDDGQLWYRVISEEIRPRDGSPPYRAEGWLVEESGEEWFLEPVR